MKRFLLFVLSLFLLTPFVTKANIAGEEIYYEYVGNSTYRVFAVFYGTCQGANYNYFTDNPAVKIYVIDSNATSPTPMTINLTPYNDNFGNAVNADTYCSKVVDNCNDPSSTYQGYVRYVYSGTVQLPNRSPKWCFEFLSEFQNCASYTAWSSMSNFQKQTSDASLNAAMYATLNNSINDNSSPVYTTLSRYGVYCPASQNIFNQTSRDNDNDSLYYSFTPTYNYYPADSCGAPLHTLVPNGGYYYTNPLPGSYNLNHLDGTLDFSAGGVSGNFYVSFTISEYRNGVLMGTSMRQRILPIESIFCGTPAIGHIDTTAGALQNAASTGLDAVTTCKGGTIGFRIPVSDAAGDTVTVSYISSTEGNISITNNTTPNPVFNYTLNTADTNVKVGTGTFTLFFSTNSCPSPSLSSETYTIVITDPNTTVGDSIMSQTQCLYKAAVRYEMENSGLPYILTLMQGTDTVRRLSDSAVYLYDSLAAGNYTMFLYTKESFCVVSTEMVVPDNGAYPYKPTAGVSPVEYCRNGADTALVAHLENGGTDLKWYDQTNNIIPAPVVPSTEIPGIYYYTVSQMYKTCESERDTMEVIIDQDVCDFDLNIHNVITPNGDGKNDLWVIDNLKFYPDAKVEVFDKLGDKVYEQEHYSNTWDGGKIPSGVYYYTLDLGKPNIVTGVQTYTGYIMIKR